MQYYQERSIQTPALTMHAISVLLNPCALFFLPGPKMSPSTEFTFYVFCLASAGTRTAAPLATGAAGEDPHKKQEEAPPPPALQWRQHPTQGAGGAVVTQPRWVLRHVCRLQVSERLQVRLCTCSIHWPVTPLDVLRFQNSCVACLLCTFISDFMILSLHNEALANK